ncbi:hypothetical protein SARC_09635 [Sphaeroforma arctica JP610]|uniref:C4-dicarboxylate transporter/malic acid transport protein n=1 Tax=Sphaeroforma arctica JP610 TaxID=667725 RepID=A0A0L0FMD1_9EUKA|nr:hypothetical protein SARC_09635 [Sphaeroforma arctica JP610]KNC77922.1 hypothetical protein SARC_09635 [Sphaeroforma arctica JP610]|eukprot:XP_014151824.1 hypothetical protein SARC_09635 [Sphaeroforma arctica JP610]
MLLSTYTKMPNQESSYHIGDGPDTDALEADPPTKPLSIIKNFQLGWFAMVMGWGGTALALNILPGVSDDIHTVLNIIGTVIWVWDLIYCIIFSSLLLARIVLYPKPYWEMMKGPAQFLFFGCMPMGVAVVGMGFVPFGPNIMSEKVAYEIAYVLFYLDVALSVIAMVLPPFMMVVYQKHTPENMQSLWLLPFVSCVVAAAQAGVVGPVMEDLSRQQDILFTGFILWGAGILTAAPIIAIYMSRLVFYGFPPNGLGNSVWVILGPIGQGCNAIVMLGRNAGQLQCTGHFCPDKTTIMDTCACSGALTPLGAFGYVLPGITLMTGCVMWGIGVWWLFMASTGSIYHASIVDKAIKKVHNPISRNQSFLTPDNKGRLSETTINQPQRRPRALPFNLGWWGVVFPFVTLIMGTGQLYIDTGFGWFMWCGRIFTVCLVIISFYVHIKTISKAVTRQFWVNFG